MAVYYLVITTFTLIIWGIDKYRAIAGQWRVPEKWLLALILGGGSFGALAGMLSFRHKTRKAGFWIIVIIACALHGWILVRWVLPTLI